MRVAPTRPARSCPSHRGRRRRRAELQAHAVQLHPVDRAVPVHVDLGVEPCRQGLDPQPAQQAFHPRLEPGDPPLYPLGTGAVQLAHPPQGVLRGHGDERESGRNGQVGLMPKLRDDRSNEIRQPAAKERHERDLEVIVEPVGGKLVHIEPDGAPMALCRGAPLRWRPRRWQTALLTANHVSGHAAGHVSWHTSGHASGHAATSQRAHPLLAT
eukprot:scaffold41210_cov66-Phaeocystis_antarctica.AAC.14